MLLKNAIPLPYRHNPRPYEGNGVDERCRLFAFLPIPRLLIRHVWKGRRKERRMFLGTCTQTGVEREKEREREREGGRSCRGIRRSSCFTITTVAPFGGYCPEDSRISLDLISFWPERLRETAVAPRVERSSQRKPSAVFCIILILCATPREKPRE